MSPQETLAAMNPNDGHAPVSLSLKKAEQLYAEYLALPIGQKLELTLMPEHVADRTHRLIDDIADLTRLDALLSNADEKAAVALLDMKRKIKERMAKEQPATAQNQGPTQEEIDEIDRAYRKLFGSDSPGQE